MEVPPEYFPASIRSLQWKTEPGASSKECKWRKWEIRQLGEEVGVSLEREATVWARRRRSRVTQPSKNEDYRCGPPFLKTSAMVPMTPDSFFSQWLSLYGFLGLCTSYGSGLFGSPYKSPFVSFSLHFLSPLSPPPFRAPIIRLSSRFCHKSDLGTAQDSNQTKTKLQQCGG